jgi:chromate transporter
MTQTVSLPELTRVSTRIGLLSFGGPAAQIALMHNELVEDRAWLTEDEFLRALSFCMLLPGPEAMQLATYAGWRIQGIKGGLIAGGLFLIPGACVIFLLAALYAVLGAVPLVQALFLGIKATVIVIVLQALWKLASKALTRPLAWVFAGISFVAIFALALPFPAIVLGAGVTGAVLLVGPAPPPAPLPDHGPGLRVAALGLGLWLMPLAVLWAADQTFLLQIGSFFATLAVVTFGGAYAVLAYMTQEVVTGYGWLTTPQMIDALGLAETTPGPLILVTQFVGFLAGLAAQGWGMAFAAATLTLWMTFVPCFIWIFLGAPYLDWIASRPRLTGALAGITAAVVGVILNLAVWFSLHVAFEALTTLKFGPFRIIQPQIESLNVSAVLLTAVAAFLLLRLKLSLPLTLAIMAGAGAAVGMLV